MSLALAIAMMILVPSSLVLISPGTTAVDLDWQIITVDAEGGSETSLALDADGNVHIAYTYDDGSEGTFLPDLKYANNTNGTWVTQTVDSAGSVGWGCSMALDAQGHAHISYWTYTTEDLKYATNKDGFWNITTVDSGAVSQYTSIALDPQGFAHISYQSNDRLCYANNTGGSWTTQQVDSTGFSGESSSIGIDSQGNAHISYYTVIGGSYVPGYLYYANNTGGSWSIQTLDSDEPLKIGEYHCLSIDDDDNVHIAYSWKNSTEYNQALKYINNTFGTWTASVVDDSFDPTTNYLSLDIDLNGRAHISYVQGQNGIFYATNFDGSWSHELIEADAAYQSSIKVGTDGQVHISFRTREANEHLMYATTSLVEDVQDPTVDITGPASDATYTTTSNSISLSGTAFDDFGVTYVNWTNAATSGSGTASGLTSWNIFNMDLAVGANFITVTAYDAAGNSGTDTITVTYELDTTDPIVAISSPSSSGSFTTTANSVSLAGTASDNVGVTSVTWSNAGTGSSGTCSGTTTWSASSLSLVPGTNVITVTAHDTASNQGTASLTVTYNAPDTTDPSGSITSPTNGSVHYTNETVVVVSGTAADNKGVAQVNWSNAATGASGTCVGTTNWSASIDLQEGENVIRVRVYDAAGNYLVLELMVIMDQVGPEVELSQPSADTTVLTNSTSIDLGGNASDDHLVGSVTWRNAANSEHGTCNGTSNWYAADIPLEEGENEITITVRDAAGNEESFTLLVMVDSISPSLAITSPTGGELTTNTTSVSVAGSVSDAGEVVSVNWTNSRGGSGTATVSEGNWSVNGITLSEGANLIRVTARDAFNNTASITITVTFEPDGAEGQDDEGQWLWILIPALIAVLVAVALLILRRRNKKG